MNTLEAQKRIVDNKRKYKFNLTDINLEFNLLYGEVSEACQAWREKDESLGEELADVAIYLLGIAELNHIDLGVEVEKKMLKNEKRQYKVIDGKWIKTEGE